MTDQEKLQESITIILDCFTGADGGVSFVRFKTAMEDIVAKEEMYIEPNIAAARRRVLDLVNDFARVITIANE